MSVWEGRFCWYELMSPEPEPAIGFYRAWFGWQAMPSGMEGYTLVGTSEKPEDAVGGVTKLPQPGVPPHWIGYIWVDEIEAAAKAVAANGGRIVHGPADIPGMGRFAICTDPQGAAYALYQANRVTEGEPRKGQVPVGQVGWHELYTSDVAKAFDYYAKLYGWKLESKMEMGPGQEYWIFSYGGEQMGGIGPAQGGMPPAWLYTFRVPDADEAAEQAKKLGATPMYGPMDIPGGGRAGALMDPQGAAVGYFAEPKGGAAR